MFRNWVERNIDKSYNVLLGLGSFLLVLSVILLFMSGMSQLIVEKEKRRLKRQMEKEKCQQPTDKDDEVTKNMIEGEAEK